MIFDFYNLRIKSFKSNPENWTFIIWGKGKQISYGPNYENQTLISSCTLLSDTRVFIYFAQGISKEDISGLVE